MPQPLSRVHPNPTVILGHDALEKYPEFSKAITKVIHIWTECDLILSHMVSRFLKADFEIVSAMFQALTGGEARRDAFLAAAKEALHPTDFALVRAVLRAARPSRDQRNEFVHHAWGRSPDVPDALLLADPRALNKIMLLLNKMVREFKMPPGSPSDHFDHTRIAVYREIDFIRAAQEAVDAQKWLIELYVVIGFQVPWRGAMQKQLLSQPPIQQWYQKFLNEGSP